MPKPKRTTRATHRLAIEGEDARCMTTSSIRQVRMRVASGTRRSSQPKPESRDQPADGRRGGEQAVADRTHVEDTLASRGPAPTTLPPQVTLKVTITRDRVRTAGCPSSHRTPSAMSRRTWVLPGSRTGPAGSADAGHEDGGQQHRRRSGHRTAGRVPVANSAAPIGAPASWLSVMNPVCSRAWATP